MFWNYFFVSATLTLAVSNERVITTLKHTVLRVKPTIVQGQTVEPGRIPFIVSIKSIHKKYENETILWRNLCGGTIIDARKVLTAAHCFEDSDFFLVKNPQMLRVVAGSLANLVKEYNITDNTNSTDNSSTVNNILGPVVQWRGVKQIFLHPQFSFPMNDIALIITDVPFKFDLYVQSVQVARADDEDNWMNCIVAGYGHVSHDAASKASPCLLLAYINILSKDNCSTLWEINMDKFVCSDSVVSSDVAKGDSGGPLICDTKSKTSLFSKQERLVGVICGKNFDKTTLFTRVSAYNDFIFQTRRNCDDDNVKMTSHDVQIGCRLICLYIAFVIHFVTTLL